MAGGLPWTAEEDALIARMIGEGRSSREIHTALSERWAGRRGYASVAKRRTQLKTGAVQPARERAEDLPDAPDETVHVDVGDEVGSVVVLGSTTIKSPEELFEASGMDPEVWELADEGTVKKWDVGMKIDDVPVSVPCFGVTIRVRKRWEHSSLPMPLVLKVTKFRRTKPEMVDLASVHMSDEHFPFHDPRAINVAYQIIDYTNPGIVAVQGDTIDCTELSKFPKDPHCRVGMKQEIQMGAEHLGTIHGLTPDADHYWHEGNHEERLRRTIWSLADNRAAGELLTLPAVREALSWGSLLGIGELGWDIVDYPDHRVLFDRLVLCHGESASAKINASEAAELKRYGRGGLSGHTHRIGYASDRKYDEELMWHGLGCLCRIRGARDGGFVSFPNWQQGFAVVTWSPDRKTYAVERVRIYDGVAYFRGKRFVGDSTAFGELARAA